MVPAFSPNGNIVPPVIVPDFGKGDTVTVKELLETSGHDPLWTIALKLVVVVNCVKEYEDDEFGIGIYVLLSIVYSQRLTGAVNPDNVNVPLALVIHKGDNGPLTVPAEPEDSEMVKGVEMDTEQLPFWTTALKLVDCDKLLKPRVELVWLIIVLEAKLSIELCQFRMDPTKPLSVKVPELLPEQKLEAGPAIVPLAELGTTNTVAIPDIVEVHDPDWTMALKLVVVVKLLKL
jgi:hypothetical protein